MDRTGSKKPPHIDLTQGELPDESRGGPNNGLNNGPNNGLNDEPQIGSENGPDTARALENEQNSSILGLEIKERGLVWCGLDVVTIRWDVETVTVDQHGSTAKISGYTLAYRDGRRQFVPSYRVVRIIKASSSQG